MQWLIFPASVLSPNPSLGRRLKSGVCLYPAEGGCLLETPPLRFFLSLSQYTQDMVFDLTQTQTLSSGEFINSRDRAQVSLQESSKKAQVSSRTFWSCLGHAGYKSCSSAFCSFQSNSWQPGNKSLFFLS